MNCYSYSELIRVKLYIRATFCRLAAEHYIGLIYTILNIHNIFITDLYTYILYSVSSKDIISIWIHIVDRPRIPCAILYNISGASVAEGVKGGLHVSPTFSHNPSVCLVCLYT